MSNLNDFYEYYRENCDIFNMIESKTDESYKWLSNIFVLASIFALFSVSYIVINYNLTEELKKMFLVSPVVSIIVFFIFNYKMKKAITESYKNIHPNFLWNSGNVIEKLNDIRVKKLSSYIKKKNISNSDLKEYKREAELELENLKPKLWSVPSYLVIIFTILFDKYLSIFIQISKITSYEEIISNASIVIGFVILLIIIGGSIYQGIYKGVFHDIRSIRYSRYKNFYLIFKEVKIDKKQHYMFE